MTEVDDLGLDAKHKELFEQFKKNVATLLKLNYYHHEDWQLVKYCQARRFDLRKAEDMFRQANELREKKRLDYMLEEYQPHEIPAKYVTGGLCGFDKEGRPIRIERFGMLDIKGLVYACTKNDMEMFKLYEQELVVKTLQEQSQKLGKRIHQLFVIMDLTGISSAQLWRPGLKLYLELVKLLEDNYPEYAYRIMVVNAPRIFPIFFKICRPLMSDDSKKKLHVYGADYQQSLLELIDAEQLPVYLGGKMTGPDGDQFCTDKVRPGGTVPESRYLKELIDLESLETTTINAGSKLLLKVPIDQPNCVIRWEFMTTNKDIGFSVTLLTDETEKKEIVPMQRVSCHIVPEYGSITCDELGTYIVTFDNSYAWTKSKKLLYNLEALIEDQDTIEEVKEVKRY